MRLSHYFLPLLKETPQEAQIRSHQLMLRTGMICQEAAGIYTWLPLGLRVLKKVEAIVREGMDAIGCQELLMPTVQPADLWRATGRYDSYGKEMLRISDRHEKEYVYGPTNEDMITNLFKKFIKSYRQLPKCLYHIQWKFRDEIRPRFGIMRGREFLMKDAYSFDLTFEGARATYFKMMGAYLKIFARMGITVVPVKAPTGPIGGDLSHEFHILAETGESKLFYDKTFDTLQYDGTVNVEEILARYAVEEEMHNPATCPLAAEDLREARGIEVGHIFYFGTKYSASIGATVVNEDGKSVLPECGSYGIGVGRVVAGIIEAFHDEAGIKWPRSVAPFTVGLINLKRGHSEVDEWCEEIYQALGRASIDVLYDDTEDSAGVKFSRMDLIGLPFQVIVGPKGLESRQIEVKNRMTGERSHLSFESFIALLKE